MGHLILKKAAWLASLAALSLIPTAAAQCSRQTLLATAETYIAAQTSGKLGQLEKLFDASGVAYTLNNKKADVRAAGAVLSKALVIEHNRTIVDTTACATYTELISTGGPYVMGTQIRSSADGARITAIDTQAATKGSWLFDAKKTLGYVQGEDWGTLAEAKRSSREVLRNAADAYLNMWSNSTAMAAVPWGTPCARTEGGMHVTPSCTAGAPNGGNMQIGNRRYVIDETVGSIDVLCSFGSMPDSHEFRLVSGKLVLVHATTV